MGRSRGIWNDPEWNRGDDLLGTLGLNIEFDFAGNLGMLFLVRIRLSVYRPFFAIRPAQEMRLV
jgi:hypothetical protein